MIDDTALSVLALAIASAGFPIWIFLELEEWAQSRKTKSRSLMG